MAINQYIKLLLVNFCSIILLINFTQALYEDQIKKFDWRRLNVGKLNDAIFDPIPSNNRIIATTDENVLAAICTRTGTIQWRQIMEKSPRGDIKLFKFITTDDHDSNNNNKDDDYESNSAAMNRNMAVYDIITVTGIAPAIVRGWSAGSGNIEFEWSILPLQADKAETAMWFYLDLHLYHVLPIWNSHIEVTKYFATTGHSKSGSTSKIIAPWIDNHKCIRADQYFICIEKNKLIYLDLSLDQPQILHKTLPAELKELPRPIKGVSGVILVDGKFISLNENQKVCSQIEGQQIIQSKYNKNSVYVSLTLNNQTLQISLTNVNNCEKIHDYGVSIDYPNFYGEPEILEFNCRFKRNNEKICSVVLTTADGATLFIQQDKIRWFREESLTNIVAVELMDLPLADSEGAIEKELNSKTDEDGAEWDITGAFLRRITSQILLTKSTMLHLLGLGLPQTDTQKAGLIRDAFGLHKMLIILTKTGKLFGMNNLNGKLYWEKYLPQLQNFNSKEPMRLLVQRTSKHFPHQPLCTIVARHSITNNGVIYRFNPITGEPAEGGLLVLNYRIKQMALLNEIENEFVKGLLLLDDTNKIHVIPENAKEKADGMYLYTADDKMSTVTGYHVFLKNNILKSMPIWNTRLGGHGDAHSIVAISAKNSIENVHSQGRVLADRSVLYKYINPNLVAFVTQGLDPIFKYVLNIYLVDVVSGSVVFSMTHKRARAPLHIVHSENWLVYSYWNDKVRRTELTTIELYEGKIQANSTVWSSLDAPPMPLVERQTYIVPTSIEALRETITERGITNKHVLMATSNGGIVEMPWALLDPRRPISGPNQIREEGSIPYIPELPLPIENFINYNQTVSRISSIYTSPSGLESTCLVVAYGLDMFVTRVSPSKTFDLLKEDFDYFLITIVLFALTTSSFLVKHLSSRKALKQAWK